MNKQEIIKYIDKHTKGIYVRFDSVDFRQIYNAMLEVKSMIKELDEWVDVRDRLPEESGYYFVTRDKGSWGVFGNEVHKNFFNGEKWLVDFNGTDITHQVIAWKKVEPYERKE